MKRIAVLIPLFLNASMLSAAIAEEPSFDCATATKPDEKAICASDELSRLDNIEAAGYAELRRKRGHSFANSVTLPLLHQRQACGGDANCVKKVQAAAIEKFRALGALAQAPPDISPAQLAAENDQSPAAETDGPDPAVMASVLDTLTGLVGATVDSTTEGGNRTVALTIDRNKLNQSFDKLQTLKLINPDVTQTFVALHPNVLSMTMATEMIVMAIIVEYKNNPTDKSSFAANILVSDDYGQQKKIPIFTFGFDRALFNKINWSNFDDSNLAKVAYRYKMSPWAIAHFMD